MIEENPSDEIIETIHNPDTNTEINLNSISLTSESSSSISQLKVPIKNHTKIIEKIIEEYYMDLTEVLPIFDLYEE